MRQLGDQGLQRDRKADRLFKPTIASDDLYQTEKPAVNSMLIKDVDLLKIIIDTTRRR